MAQVLRSSSFSSSIFLLPEGAFVSMVMEGSPAAKGGLRFGDQILEVDQASLAGLNSDQVNSHSLDLDFKSNSASFLILLL